MSSQTFSFIIYFKMSIYRYIIIILLIQQVFSKGCTDEQTFEEGKDYFPYKINLTYSNIYTVTYYNTYVDIKYSFRNETIKYALVRCGLKPPEKYVNTNIFFFVVTKI